MKTTKSIMGLLLIGVILTSGMPLAYAGPPPEPEPPWFGASGPGLHVTDLIAGQYMDDPAGTVRVFNSREKLHIQVEPSGGWLINTIQIYVGVDPVPTVKSGNPDQGAFPYKQELPGPAPNYTLVLDLVDDLGFSWGQPYEYRRIQNIAVHADLVKLDTDGTTNGPKIRVLEEEGAWAFGEGVFEGGRWSWWFKYEMTHPQRGHFIDSPVGGLSFETPTHTGKTDESGGFDYFPGERVELYVGSVPLGTPLAGHKISPLDIYENADTDDPRVINIARLLQSLNANGDPNEGIGITEDVVACLEGAVQGLGLTGVDFFAVDAQTEAVIQETIAQCAGVEGVTLVAVSAEDAKANLDRSLDSNMFRKDISRTPDLTSSKSKLNIMGMWFPALRANNVSTVIEYSDENGNLIRTADQAKPVVVVYTDGIEETGYEDIFAAISRDDGNTFKRTNIARAADRSSFTLLNGDAFYGQAKKPVFQVKGNNILVAWTSKFCSGGKPAYAITTCDDPDTEAIETADPETGLCRVTCHGDGDNEVCEADYPYDDPYYTEDIWGVGGPQRSVDYTDQGFPEVGEVPYSCVWVARGTIVTQGMIDSQNGTSFWANSAVGDIQWFKPERLTSGRRDANQVFMGASDGAGFAIAWQEDPDGLRPGAAAGPGPGWGGATTHHKTDIWYSYITMADFRKVDANFEPGGDPQHDHGDLVGRPKALVPMAFPVRLSDNDAVNTDNLRVELDEDLTSPGYGYPVEDGDGNWIPTTNPDALADDADGTHAYGYEIEGLCEDFYDFTNYAGDEKSVCITADGRLLDGNTGASRPNVFLQTYTKPDGTKSAWAILAYEETKGAGIGPPDHTEDPPYGDEPLPEAGKNAIYHSFDFQNPDLVSAGNIINLPERDADGNLMYQREVSLDGDGNVVYGDLILDYLGLPQLAYENARRPRFIIQGKAAMGDSNTVMIVLYKEGQEGMGRPSDIMLRRVVSNTSGNPYAFTNFVCNTWEVADNGLTVCVDGTQNMSTVFPTVVTDSMGDPISDDPWGAVKVVQWEQTPEILANASWVNPYEEARAHRGAIRGDFIVMGYSYTPNWAAARNGNDKYDFFIRRSFDGGLTWTTDPAGEGVTHCRTSTDPVAKIKTEVCTFYPAGDFEQARNLSQLPNSKESVIEPRIVGAPGTIKVDGVWTGIAEDKQNQSVFYVSYGTATNPPVVHGDSEEVQEYPAPLDLYYSFSQDRGESYWESTWVVNPDSEGNYPGETVTGMPWLAKGEPEQGEAQLRMTPDGSRFYATWLQDAEDSSDIFFRRITPSTFPINVAPE
ncbi:MAG: hypothetical protein ISS49_09035 [Anaerolineae bacterium]|nr:hypothetical protein [Anaerolineae bacterium]